ncbi:MAG TPA: peptide-methionine (S)-S-oxide reductase MsrA [Gammaproteobacteria bacterium]|nr:peptide-methionine (S)-S-oxide reductase MsrA [Gammaproteobacteria bacterium]
MAVQCEMPKAVASHAADFPDPPMDMRTASGPQHAVLSGGCFWCTEAVYRQLDGVLNVISVYTGGSAETANYAAVSSGTTEHAEAVAIEYDPTRLSFGVILKAFFSAAHDPTQVDRQGDDHGRHYRSAIFYASEEQKKIAQAYIDLLNGSAVFDASMATVLEPLGAVYPAEAEFQNYVARNPTDPYVVKNSLPKVEKLRARFAGQLKS